MSIPDPLAQALSHRYAIERELGAGGMGTVYLARDLRHDRQVALKVFRPAVEAAVGSERFLREIRLAASLTHPHLLALFDSGEAGGYLYYVSPYIEGESLKARIRREGPLPVPDAVRILHALADALATAHVAGIVHRDLKPANVLLSGRHALLADFGVAKALDQASGEDELTAFGMTVGTPQYMAPEQAAGEPHVDHRADIYALGILGYEMLTGSPPFHGPSSQGVLAAHLTQPPEPITAKRQGVPPALAEVIMRCLEKRPEDRYQHAAELAGDLEAVTTPSGSALAGNRRRWVIAGAVIVAGLIVGGIWISVGVGPDETWVREQAIPEIEELLREGLYDDAWAVARRAQAIAPENPDVAQLLVEFTVPWSGLDTDPPGARVLYRPYREPEAPWEELGTTPMDSLRLPLVSASVLRLELDGYRPVKMVPDVQYLLAGAPLFTLDPPDRLPEDMVRIPGWSQTIAGEKVDLGDFYMDRYEVTNREYQRFVDAGGYRDPRYWEHPFMLDGDPLSWESAMGQFTDQTGRPGPSTWHVGSYREGQGDYPVGGISWYEAAAYANFAGKSLPTVYHWRRAYGSNFFRAHVIPQSNLHSDGPAPVGEHAGMGPFGTFDMAGNVREWCYNAVGEDRYILGGGWDDPDYLAMSTGFTQPAFDRSPTNGIRLVTLLDEEGDAGILRAIEPVEPTPVPDFRELVSPPTDEEFKIYRRMFAYDPVPLEPRIEKVDTTRHWVEKRISFNAAYNGERMLLYLYLPRSARPPFQTVVYWSGSGMLVMTRTEPGLATMFAEFIVQSGRALAFPVLKGTLERHAEQPPRRTIRYRDRRIEQVQDVMRTLDYLESRDDIDADRLAYYGLSWGGPVAPLPLALEPRFTAAVLNVAGIRRARPQPEVDELNYLARVALPVLMLSGRLDANFPLETSARPFFDLLGTPPDDKRHFVAEGGHFVPRPDLIRESLDWFDRYLGPVER
jgi:eukaryotic-like serine/threonine-protein kinase